MTFLKRWITHFFLFVTPFAFVSTASVKTRMEKDSLGERQIPNNVYWGAQTSRAMENFPFNTKKLQDFPNFIAAYAYVKKAAAEANNQLEILSQIKLDAISKACDEIISGKLNNQFPLDMMQGGAGTSTNMNFNEVIANRALEIMGKQKGNYKFMHPNDDINLSQSTNDTYPTAAKLAVIMETKQTLNSLRELKIALANKGKEFKDVIKMGRTEMQDAVPVTLGQEFYGFSDTINEAMIQLEQAQQAFMKINLGGTAVGTGINTLPNYSALAIKNLAELTGVPFVASHDFIGASSDGAGYIQMSGALKRTGIAVSKICNDLRLMSSGPRTGFYEIILPALQPGSSIMPGKINPVIPEVVSSIAYQLAGYDTTVTMAAELSSLELNPVECVIVYDLLCGSSLLTKAIDVLTKKCVIGIQANTQRCRDLLMGSVALVTALSPVLGYERSTFIAHEALATGRPVYDLVLEKGWLSKEQLDEMLKVENMIEPRERPRPINQSLKSKEGDSYSLISEKRYFRSIRP